MTHSILRSHDLLRIFFLPMPIHIKLSCDYRQDHNRSRDPLEYPSPTPKALLGWSEERRDADNQRRLKAPAQFVLAMKRAIPGLDAKSQREPEKDTGEATT